MGSPAHYGVLMPNFGRRYGMKEFFTQYGGMILSAAGAFAVLMIFRQNMLPPDGEFVKMILFWGNGGC